MGGRDNGQNRPIAACIQAPAGPVLFCFPHLCGQLFCLDEIQKKKPGSRAGLSITDNVRSD